MDVGKLPKQKKKTWYELGDRDGRIFVKGSPELYYVTQRYIDDNGEIRYGCTSEFKIKQPSLLIHGMPVNIIEGDTNDLPEWECNICGEKYFSQRMLDEHYKECMLPKPKDKPTRDSSRKSYNDNPRIDLLQSIWHAVLNVIDWLNGIAGVGKLKNKSKLSDEEMLSLSDLFEGYEDRPQAPEVQPTFIIKR